jgi:uroporphyrinogen decarboxylase
LDGVLGHYGAESADDLYEIAGIDGFNVWERQNAVMPAYRGELRSTDEGQTLDFWGSLSQKVFGLGHCDTTQALERHHWPRVDDFDFSQIYSRAIEIKSQDKVVAAGHVALGYQKHNELRGNEKALFDVTDVDYMRVYTAKVLDFTLEYIDRLLTAGRGEIDVVRSDDDVGSMDRLMISPAAWRNHYKPCWREAFDLVHRHGALVWFHSCGYIRPLLDDLVEIGVDAWHPFPPYVAGNDRPSIRDWRRGKLALMGGLDNYLMIHGTPEQVVDDTREVLSMFAPDGGLLIGPQIFHEDMPTENKIAFLETALSDG